MEFDFLEAADGMPLTKKFRLNNEEIETEPYPFVKNVTSHRRTANTIDELSVILQQHAEMNHCLLKGLLTEPVIRSSRAGKTVPDASTRWMLLDLDFEDGWNSIDEFIAELNPAWEDVSYVFQHSASAGIKYKPKLRGHLWILLDQSINPTLLKQWLRSRNLHMDRLCRHMQLAANGMSIRWPLDVTTCQNDKLIYIAPPQLEGIEDPIAGERFVVRKKGSDTAPVPELSSPVGLIEQCAEDRVNSLRKAAGYTKRNPKTKQFGAQEILSNPERASVTSVKEGRGFIYLNLNGGDSWGYYFPINKPDFLFNFKDEPAVRLQDIDPGFYQDYVQRMQQDKFGDLKPYVFREPYKDVYYNVIYSPTRDSLDLLRPAASKDRLGDFMAQFSQPMPDPVEDWTVEFDPTTNEVINPAEKWVNLFKPTMYIRHAPTLTKVDEVPPIINRVIQSICCGDQETVDHFLNWLAVLFQTRKRTETAWIFHGIQGTGKGVLLSRVLRPLLNPEHVTEWQIQHFEDQFNQPLEKTMLLWLDDFTVFSGKQVQTTMNKLKNYITEHEIAIRAMRSNAVQVQNHLNVIVTANHPDPIHIPEHDRRFNVAPAQETKLEMTQEEIDSIEGELVMFASFLYNYPASVDQARTIIQNEARRQMISASQTAPEQFFASFRKGDLEWFLSFLRTDMPLNETMSYQQYQRVMIDWCRRTKENIDSVEPVRVTRDEMIAAYSYIITSGMTPAKFTRMCSIHRVPVSQIRMGDKGRTQGTHIQFKASQQSLDEVLDHANESPLRAVQ